MRVCIIGGHGHVGGSQNVATQLSRALAQQVDVVRPLQATTLPKDCDVYHLVRFANYEAERHVVDACDALGKPLVLSSIYWPRYAALMWELKQRGQSTEQARHQAEAQVGRDEQHMTALLRGCAGVLPNSWAEFGILTQLMGGVTPRGQVQWHAVDDGFAGQEPVTLDPELEAALDGAWLYVGRVEHRKCYSTFAAACRRLDCKGVVIGAQSRCRANGLEHWPPIADRRALATAMRRARFGYQVSAYETPGLAAMEMAACGLPVLVGVHGCEREYFRLNAQYASGFDVETVVARMQEMAGWNNARHQIEGHYAQDQMSKYTWDTAATTCAELYEAVVG